MLRLTLSILLITATYGDELGSISNPYDAIIIGLGSSGCTAASTLAQAGKRVLALEAQDRIGGRVHTVPLGDGVVELGAEWIHGTVNSRVYDAAMKNNITPIADSNDFFLLQSDGQILDSTLVSELFEMTLKYSDEPPEDPEPLGQYLTRRLTEYIKAKYPDVAKDKDYLEEIFDHLDLSIESIEGSASWNDVTTASNYEELGGHQHMSWHRHGYKTFFDILLNTYKNGPGYPNLDIKLNKEVTLISWPQDPNQQVVVKCKDGTTYYGNNVIVTLSLGVLKERYSTLFSPQLPASKVTAIEKMSIGFLKKIVLQFEEAWWPKYYYTGFLWRPVDKRALPKDDIWLSKIVGFSVSRGNNVSFTLWVMGEEVKMVETLPDDLVKTKIMGLVRRFMGKNTTVPEPVAMLRTKWYSNPFTRGTYTYDNVLTPQYPNARVDLGKPLVDSEGNPRVLFAGEATNPTHFSTVHGAAETGYREAMRLLTTSN